MARVRRATGHCRRCDAGRHRRKDFIPIEAHGVSAMSMAFLTREKTPMVWRGPMASGALQQMIESTRWGELDVLFVDMPPGTGDIQLTLSQRTRLAGAVVVTTPQDMPSLMRAVQSRCFRRCRCRSSVWSKTWRLIFAVIAAMKTLFLAVMVAKLWQMNTKHRFLRIFPCRVSFGNQ